MKLKYLINVLLIILVVPSIIAPEDIVGLSDEDFITAIIGGDILPSDAPEKFKQLALSMSPVDVIWAINDDSLAMSNPLITNVVDQRMEESKFRKEANKEENKEFRKSWFSQHNIDDQGATIVSFSKGNVKTGTTFFSLQEIKDHHPGSILKGNGDLCLPNGDCVGKSGKNSVTINVEVKSGVTVTNIDRGIFTLASACPSDDPGCSIRQTSGVFKISRGKIIVHGKEYSSRGTVEVAVDAEKHVTLSSSTRIEDWELGRKRYVQKPVPIKIRSLGEKRVSGVIHGSVMVIDKDSMILSGNSVYQVFENGKKRLSFDAKKSTVVELSGRVNACIEDFSCAVYDPTVKSLRVVSLKNDNALSIEEARPGDVKKFIMDAMITDESKVILSTMHHVKKLKTRNYVGKVKDKEMAWDEEKGDYFPTGKEILVDSYKEVTASQKRRSYISFGKSEGKGPYEIGYSGRLSKLGSEIEFRFDNDKYGSINNKGGISCCIVDGSHENMVQVGAARDIVEEWTSGLTFGKASSSYRGETAKLARERNLVYGEVKTPKSWDYTSYITNPRNKDVVEAVLFESERTGIDPALLFGAMFTEGLNTHLKTGRRGIVSGYGELGLDLFGQNAARLKSQGYLRKDYVFGADYFSAKNKNEQHATVISGNFPDVARAVEAFSAQLRDRDDDMSRIFSEASQKNWDKKYIKKNDQNSDGVLQFDELPYDIRSAWVYARYNGGRVPRLVKGRLERFGPNVFTALHSDDHLNWLADREVKKAKKSIENAKKKGYSASQYTQDIVDKREKALELAKSVRYITSNPVYNSARGGMAIGNFQRALKLGRDEVASSKTFDPKKVELVLLSDDTPVPIEHEQLLEESGGVLGDGGAVVAVTGSLG